MRLPVHVEPLSGVTPAVDYRWDPDTTILSARIRLQEPAERVAVDPPSAEHPGASEADDLPRTFGPESFLSGAVELEGRDGSWIVLDLEAGHLAGVEVAVWPALRRRSALAPPIDVQNAQVRVTGRRRGSRETGDVAALEITTYLTAEADPAERTIHFCLGPRRDARSVRPGRDLLVDVDAQGHLAGLWLLNVPPVPTVT